MKHFVLAAAAAATMLIGGAAQAVTFTYAQYGETPSSGASLKFTNNGGATPSGTLSNNGPTTVKFKFFDDPSDAVTLPANLTNDMAADFYLNAVTTTSTFVLNPLNANSQIWQTFDSGTLKFTGTGAVAGSNLLTITFTGMDFTSRLNSGGASTFASTPDSTLNITSDFFDFSSVNASNFSLSLSAVIPTISLGANNLLSSFVANSTGTFASDPAPLYVPEPGMLGLFGAGAFALAFARRRKS